MRAQRRTGSTKWPSVPELHAQHSTDFRFSPEFISAFSASTSSTPSASVKSILSEDDVEDEKKVYAENEIRLEKIV